MSNANSQQHATKYGVTLIKWLVSTASLLLGLLAAFAMLVAAYFMVDFQEKLLHAAAVAVVFVILFKNQSVGHKVWGYLASVVCLVAAAVMPNARDQLISGASLIAMLTAVFL